MKNNVKLGLIGSISGFFNGFVGGFGALISILSLKKYYYLGQKEAQATSMAYMFIVSIITSAILIYGNNINIEIKEVLMIIFSNFWGATLGYFIFSKLPNKGLNFIFGLIIVVAGVMMLWF